MLSSPDLSQRLEATLAPDTILPTIVETVAQALKLPYAAILLKQDDQFTIAAYAGNEMAESLVLPLVYQRETIGKLLLAPRSPGEGFTPADLRLLNALTREIGLAAYTVRLTSDLQRSNEHLQSARARLVTTLEEERRRLRRDLHGWPGVGADQRDIPA
jgi:GAF domain-containing protein